MQVAAPLAPMGYLPVSVGAVRLVNQFEAGQLYQLTKQRINQGLPSGLARTGYTLIGKRVAVPHFGTVTESQPPSVHIAAQVYLMAVSPRAEAELMGLSQAVVEGHYFTAADEAPQTHQIQLPARTVTVHDIPVLLTTVSPEAGRLTATVQRLPEPPGLKPRIDRLATTLLQVRPGHPLGSLRGPVVGRLSVSQAAIWAAVLRAVRGQAPAALDGHALTAVPVGQLTFLQDALAMSGSLSLPRTASPLLGVPVARPIAGAAILGVTLVSELAGLPAAWAVRRQDPVPVLKGDAG